jgi:hypothetical protein
MEIYGHAQSLNSLFGPTCELKLPVKVNFFLQKNIKILLEAAQDIETNRLLIAKNYGKLNEDGTAYSIDPANTELVNKELANLFEIKQEVTIHMFKLEDFDGLEFTFAQMNALMFMIEE